MTAIRRALLTGGNGYIGSALLQRLQNDGVEVHAIANRNRNLLDKLLSPSQVHSASAGNDFLSDLVRRLEPDVIFHLASIQEEPASLSAMIGMIQTNVNVGTALLHGAAAARNKPAFLNTGSYWQFTENEAYAPKTFYAATKQAFHDLMLYFCRVHHVRAMTLVLYDSFGRDDTRPKIWTQLLNAPPGSRFPLTEGHQYIELVHIDDIARAFIHAAEMLLQGKGLNGIYSVRSEERITLRQMLERWSRHAGLNLELDWGAIQYWDGQVFHPWRGEILPDWHPEIDVHTVVAEWLRDQRKVRRDQVSRSSSSPKY